MMRRLAASQLLIALVLTIGCHQYHPAEPQSVSRGSEVRVRLTSEGHKSLAERTIRFERQLVGSLLRVGPDSVWLVSPRGNRNTASPAATIRDTLALPRDHVERLEKRELSLLRTAGIFGGGAVGVGIIAAATASDPQDANSPREPGDSGEATIAIPVSISVP